MKAKEYNKLIRELLKIFKPMELALKLDCSVISILNWREDKKNPREVYRGMIVKLHNLNCKGGK